MGIGSEKRPYFFAFFVFSLVFLVAGASANVLSIEDAIGPDGAGSYSVSAIPSSTPAGTIYRIKVSSTLSADCSDMSDGTFTIS